MALLDEAFDRLGRKVAPATEAWVREGAGRVAADFVPRLDPGLQGGANEALATLQGAAPLLGRLTHAGFTQVTGLVAAGMTEDARLVYLRDRATHAERMSAVRAAADAALQHHATAEADWEATKAVALKIVQLLGKAALTFLLAMA